MEETRKRVTVIIPVCDCMKKDKDCFSKLEKLLKAVNESYAAIGLDIEALLCGLHVNDTKAEQSFCDARYDFFAKAHKFKAFSNIKVSFQFILHCKDDTQALCYGVKALGERWKVDKPEHAVTCRYDEAIDKKTWVWTEFKENRLQTLEQFLDNFKLCHEDLRHPVAAKAKSSIQLLTFITRKLDRNPFGENLLTFSDREEACPDILVKKDDAGWCKHILKTCPRWIVKNLKSWGWIDEKLIQNVDERHSQELLDLLQRESTLIMKRKDGLLSLFYFTKEEELDAALSYGRFIDERTILDLNDAVRRTCTQVTVIDANLFIQHFFSQEKPK